MKPFSKQASLFYILVLFSTINIAIATTSRTSTQVGKIVFVKGIASLTLPDNSIQILGRGDPLYINDLIHTGIGSKAILKLIDGTQISLIENTDFKVTLFSMQKNQEKAELQLLKGGMRTITGLINKNKTGQFTLVTPVASIGIRGTDFTSYLCESDCDDQSTTIDGNANKVNTAIKARLLVIRGQVEAVDQQNKRRVLQKQSPLYEGDTLITGKRSIAVIVFKDNSRTTVQANTEFLIKGFQFKPQQPSENHADFQLIKGSLRFLTGKIGKLNRDRYAVNTPTSSIGIRGTGFDLAYYQSTYLHLWEGAVDFKSVSGQIQVDTGQSYILAAGNTPPTLIQQIPKKFRSGPRPDSPEISKQVDLPALFGSQETSGQKGLYLYVQEGEINVANKGQQLNLGASEVGYVNKKVAYRITTLPTFLWKQFIPPNATQKALKHITMHPDIVDDLGYKDGGNICEI